MHKCLNQFFFQGEGLFAKRDIPAETLIVQYGGVRFKSNAEFNILTYRSKDNAYGHTVGFCRDVVVDIPTGSEITANYNATLAHKSQHSFTNNVKTTQVQA